MVMGPSAGLILADLGADVVKIEPIGGDKTRRLPGSGSGYFAMFNRNKHSICLDIKRPEGAAVTRDLLKRADVMIENFRPGRSTSSVSTTTRSERSIPASSTNRPRVS